MTYYERNLPHWHPPSRWIFVTWRLYGSLPQQIVIELRQSGDVSGRQFARAERFLDGGSFGPRWLANPRVADVVTRCILHGANSLAFYQLLAFVVMPNHVHVLLDPQESMKRITGGIKGVSSREANRILDRIGQPFWQAESFDHWIRNAAESEKIRIYIEQNPVKAGLVAAPEKWPWSSAAKK